MFWLRNKNNNFQLRTLICRPTYSNRCIFFFQAYAGSSVTHRPDTTLRAEPQPSVSRVQVRPEAHTSGPFVAPTTARQSSLGSTTARQSSLGVVGSRLGNGSHPTNTSRPSSLLSRISSGSSSGSTSSYPPSLTSSEGGRSSASINSGN